jgi:predicted permease
VAQAGVSPLSDDHWDSNYSVPGRTGHYDIEFNNVSPGYFPLLGIPIVRGRNFTSAENRAGSPVAILTESTARRLWPGQDPVGQIIRDGTGEGAARLEVVGIAGDAQVASLGKTATLYLFRPAGPEQQTRMLAMAHYAGDYASALRNIKTAVEGLDPEMPVKVTRLEDNMEFWRSLTRIPSIMFAALGGVALLLATIGVYGMVSYSVSRRIREIGIRMALGAGGGRIVSLIVRQGMRPVIVGAAIGMACSAAVSSLMSSLLYGVSPWDPISFISVAAFLSAVSLAACWAPARRAARVDPMESLRRG